MSITIPFDLTDEQLVAALPRLAGDERQVTARLVAHLAEVDRRRLYVARGYSSLYTYCREGLGYSEDAAHNRKVAARIARRYPAVVDMMGDGRLSLTAVRLLAAVLRDDNWPAVLAEAAGGSKREVELLVARLAPKPDVPSTVRKLPRASAVPDRRTNAAERTEVGEGAGSGEAVARGEAVKSGEATGAVPERQAEGAEAGGGEGAAAREGTGTGERTAGGEAARKDEAVAADLRRQDRMSGSQAASDDSRGPATSVQPQPAAVKRPVVAPLSATRFRVQFTIGEDTERKLRRLQELLRREIPSGDPALIFDRALTSLLAKVESRKHGATARPRKGRAPRGGSRSVPAATRREVAPRDSGQCTFVGAGGRRCTERAYVEYHHAGRPFAHGGGPGAENIALHCRAHNAFEGERIFGRFLPAEVREARLIYDAMRFPVPERRPVEGPQPAPDGDRRQ